MRRAAFCTLLGALLAVAPAALAREGKPRVVVVAEGRGSEPLGDEARKVLGDGVEEEPIADLARAWTTVGAEGAPRLDAAGRMHREALLSFMRRATRTAGLDAVVVIRTPPRRGPTHVVVIVPTSDAPIVDAYVDRNPKIAQADLREWLVDAVGASSAPPPPVPPPPPSHGPDPETPALLAASDAVAPDVSRADAPPPVSSPWLDASAGLALGVRDLHYNDRVSTNLRSYTIVGAPLAAAAIDVAPPAALVPGSLRGLGLIGGYATSIGLSSSVNGSDLPTSWSRYYLGPRYRLGVLAGLTLGGSVTYQGESFAFSGATAPLSADLPAVDYRAVRPAVEARFVLGRISIAADVGYEDVLSSGDVGARMHGTSVAGVDAGAAVSLALALGFEARLAGGYRRYFYAFHPVAGDPYVAGGAVDQMASLEAAIAWVR